jgi:hypothetical protein
LVFFSKEEPKGKPHLCKEMNPEPQKKKKNNNLDFEFTYFLAFRLPCLPPTQSLKPFLSPTLFPILQSPLKRTKEKYKETKEDVSQFCFCIHQHALHLSLLNVPTM